LENGANIDHQNNDGYTALKAAAQEGHKDTLQILLDNGANKDHQDIFGQTALILAAANSKKDVVQLLLNRRANTRLIVTSGIWSGRTACYWNFLLGYIIPSCY